MRLLSADEMVTVLPLRESIDAISAAFIDITQGQSLVAERQALAVPGGTGLLMGAAGESQGIAAKLVSVMPGNSARGLPGTLGLLLLNDDETGEPLALMDGTAFTARRTAAVTACATRLLAREDARQGLLIGTGAQAETQLLALDAIRDLDMITVQGREFDQAREFVSRHKGKTRATLSACTHLEDSLAKADIIITATNSETPLFMADSLSAGTHVSGIGSFRVGMCENDPTLAAVSRVFVESRHSALTEAGELIAASESGLTDPGQWAEVGECLSGKAPGRESSEQLTFFKSVGHAVFDLHLARLAFDQAERLDLGMRWSP